MQLVTNTEIISDWFGDKKALELIKKAGFDGADYSMFNMMSESSPLNGNDYKAYVKELSDYSKSIGISFVQGHSPFPGFDRSRPEYSERIAPLIRRSIEIAGMLGIEYLVIHPISPTQIPLDVDLFEFNMKYYKSLLPYAKEYGVKICLENMWGYDAKRGYIMPNVCSFAKDLSDYVDALDSEYFTACLDLGHSGLIGEEASDAIRILGHDRLSALHVHDNDYKNDTHTLPYYGKMNWDEITKALSDIKYKGRFTYEAAVFLKPLPHEQEAVLAGLKYMEAIGRFLIKKIEL